MIGATKSVVAQAKLMSNGIYYEPHGALKNAYMYTHLELITIGGGVGAFANPT